MEELLTYKQVAERLGIEPNEVYNLPIPRVRLSERRLRWRGADISAWLAGQVQDDGPRSPHRHVARLREAAMNVLVNAVLVPDPRMAGATDAYLVTLDDINGLSRALAGE